MIWFYKKLCQLILNLYRRANICESPSSFYAMLLDKWGVYFQKVYKIGNEIMNSNGQTFQRKNRFRGVALNMFLIFIQQLCISSIWTLYLLEIRANSWTLQIIRPHVVYSAIDFLYGSLDFSDNFCSFYVLFLVRIHLKIKL